MTNSRFSPLDHRELPLAEMKRRAASDPGVKRRIRQGAEEARRLGQGGRRPTKAHLVPGGRARWGLALRAAPQPTSGGVEVLHRPSRERPFLILVTGSPASDATVPDIRRKPLPEIATFV